VADAQITAGRARLELVDGVSPNTILQAATQSARIDRFELVRPDLQEIFVKLVAADAEAAGRPDDVRVAEAVS
jgi:ABC-type uncharacterized transport system ATPase subunit